MKKSKKKEDKDPHKEDETKEEVEDNKEDIDNTVEENKEDIAKENPVKENQTEKKEEIEDKQEIKEKPTEKKEQEKKEGEEVCETFKIEKDGKEELVKTCGTESTNNKEPDKKQVQSQNKILKNVLMGIAILSIVFVSMYLIIDSMKHFEYEGISFDIVKEGTRMTGNLILYQTSIPIMYQGEIADYNFYMRNDPRKLKDVPFDGKLFLTKNIVIDMKDDFHCDGDGVIAIANMAKLFEILGSEVMTDENASCDAQGRYNFIQIKPGEITSIEQTGPACYTLNVNNCEILEVTERLMVESFVIINKELEKA